MGFRKAQGPGGWGCIDDVVVTCKKSRVLVLVLVRHSGLMGDCEIMG